MTNDDINELPDIQGYSDYYRTKEQSARPDSVNTPTPEDDPLPNFTKFILDTGALYENVHIHHHIENFKFERNRKKRINDYLTKYFCEAFKNILRKELNAE